jgi:hypothetical protein
VHVAQVFDALSNTGGEEVLQGAFFGEETV